MEFVAHVAVVAHVADVAIVIDRKRGMKAKFSLPLIDSRSIIGCQKNANKEIMLPSTSRRLPNITLITFITLLTLVSIESIAKRFTHPAHVASA